MIDLPTGTVTFLFTDIEGSTMLAQQFPAEMPALLARHHAILHQAIQAHHGHVFQITGDAFCAAFYTASDALKAALDAQRELQHEAWLPAPIKVRMGLHTGAAQAGVIDERAGGYVGYLTLTRVQRVMSVAHGEQVLLSNPTAELVRGELPASVTLRDMGEHRLKGLLNPEHLWQLVAPDTRQDFLPLQSLNAIPNNLPVQLTSFIGRENEIIEVKQELTEHRLVTLTGSGGTGKTRLSLRVAADVLDHFDQGVWFVELAPLSDVTLVPNVVLNTLGLRDEMGRTPLDLLADFLRARKVLLILDNCEHLIQACAQVAHHLLTHCPPIRILATSREALDIAGEAIYHVPSLSLPDSKHLPPLQALSQFEAVRLFVDRATAVQPQFAVTNSNAPAVAQICDHLDGIPLAIELAAARVKLFSPEQIAARLDDRFRLLTGKSRSAVPRQQTLRALIDWSWDLLSEAERVLLRRLSVFVGGWAIEAAEIACAGGSIHSADVVDLLTQLVNKSLVTVEHEQGDETRYRLLETIRQYARDKLLESGEGPHYRDQHLAYFLRFAETAELELHRRDQANWLARLATEHDNLRTALEWSLETNVEASLRLAGALAEFWDTRGYVQEGRTWLDKVLAAGRNEPPTLAIVKVVYGAAMLVARQTDALQARTLVERGLALSRELGDKAGIARGLDLISVFANFFEQTHDQMDVLFAESLEIWRELGDKRGIGQALGPMAARAAKRHDYHEAARLYRESLGLFRDVGDQRQIAGALSNLAEVVIVQQSYAQARAYAEESLALYRELEDKHGVATALRTLGEVARHQNESGPCQQYFESSAALFAELGDRECRALTLCSLGGFVQSQGDLQRAAALAEESLASFRDLGYQEGVTAALDLLGRTILAQGNATRARQVFAEALALQRELGDRQAAASLLEGLAGAAILEQPPQPLRAAQLLGAAETLRESIAAPIAQDVARGDYDHHLTTVRAALSEEAFAAAWARGRAMTMDQAIEFALEERV